MSWYIFSAFTFVMAISCPVALAEDVGYFSPEAIAVSPDGATVYVAEATTAQVAVLNGKDGSLLRVCTLPENPTGLAISKSGAELYVTGGVQNGIVYVLESASGKIKNKVKVGHSPLAPVLSPDGRKIYVCNRFNNNISVVDLEAAKEIATMAVLREPVAAALTADGQFLFVANHLPFGAIKDDNVAATISVLDTKTGTSCAEIHLPNGSTSLRGLCLSPDGKQVYVTHIIGRYQLPTTQVERGWMNTNALSVIDAEQKELVTAVLLDEVALGAANPWGVACSPDGKYVCVTHSGTHEVSVIDQRTMLDKIAANRDAKVKGAAGATGIKSIANELTFLNDIRKRIRLSGKGPRGIAVAGNTAYVAEYFSDTVAGIDLANPQGAIQSFPLGPKRALTDVRRGEMIFHDGTACFQQWQSCVSCHPGARADGLNWDLLNDGIGNPKQVKNMLNAHVTPPAMITGIRGSAEKAVRAGMKYILFSEISEGDAKATDEYLKSLQPVPSPYLVNGKLSASAERGKVLFEKATCINCHSGSLFTGLRAFNVGTGKGREAAQKFDTPSLVEIWRTAPYLNDGSAATIREVLTSHNTDDKHGVTSSLTAEQIQDLENYVLSQ